MIWAEYNYNKIKAEPEFKGAICPLCKLNVIPKCGTIKIWHWAHQILEDCDSFAEPETQWHLNWKNEFPKECQEITIKKCISDYCNDLRYHTPCSHIDCVDCEFKRHRADLKINNLIIELQNSSICTKEIQEREKFYGNIIWLFNGENFATNLNLRQKNGIITFRWKHPPKSLWSAKKPIYIHLKGKTGIGHFDGNQIFLIKKIYQSLPCGGWGILLSKEEFLKQVKGNATE